MKFIHKHSWKSTGGSRFDETFECTDCPITKWVHDGISKKGYSETRIKYGINFKKHEI